jgi:hypothetical protein
VRAPPFLPFFITSLAGFSPGLSGIEPWLLPPPELLLPPPLLELELLLEPPHAATPAAASTAIAGAITARMDVLMDFLLLVDAM